MFKMTPEDEKEFLYECIAIAKRNRAGFPPAGTADILPRSDSYSEAHSDYYGFPSNPLSIYHTGDPWPKPTGPEAQRVPKEARPICIHPIARVWHKLGPQIYKYFDSVGLKWTSIDPVRFAEAGKEAGPLFLWVGVMPRTLSREDAEAASVRCKQILAESQLTTVEIAFRESVFTRSIGPQLLNHVPSVDPTADVRSPFTPTLGLQISPKAHSEFQGTGGLYLCEGGERNRDLLLTARHVVLPLSKCPNELYACKATSSLHHEVILLGSKAYQEALESIMSKIAHEHLMVDYYKDELEGLGVATEGEAAAIADERENFKGKLAEAEKSEVILKEFHTRIVKFWSTESQRILGHVFFSPPISIGMGDKHFTEDWALIELHHDKIHGQGGFKGNVIHLGTKFTPADFMLKMYPHAESRTTFKYPHGGLLQLRGAVKENELRNPTMLDVDGEKCLIVVKNGGATGVTIGRATGIESFVREYTGITPTTSMGVAIYPYSHKDGAFSDAGDSGSIIADANSHIVGILTGGTGQTDAIDVTYASPYYWVEEHIKKAFPDSYLYPILT